MIGLPNVPSTALNRRSLQLYSMVAVRPPLVAGSTETIVPANVATAPSSFAPRRQRVICQPASVVGTPRSMEPLLVMTPRIRVTSMGSSGSGRLAKRASNEERTPRGAVKPGKLVCVAVGVCHGGPTRLDGGVRERAPHRSRRDGAARGVEQLGPDLSIELPSTGGEVGLLAGESCPGRIGVDLDDCPDPLAAASENAVVDLLDVAPRPPGPAPSRARARLSWIGARETSTRGSAEGWAWHRVSWGSSECLLSSR